MNDHFLSFLGEFRFDVKMSRLKVRSRSELKLSRRVKLKSQLDDLDRLIILSPTVLGVKLKSIVTVGVNFHTIDSFSTFSVRASHWMSTILFSTLSTRDSRSRMACCVHSASSLWI